MDADRFEKMRKQYSDYASRRGYELNPDQGVVEGVFERLLVHQEKHGRRYCPCMFVDPNREKNAGRVCPCSTHEEEIRENGQCHCGLFVRRN
jgi:ferredoxin-thioredoxin reductase catalytic subunit